MSRFQRDCQLIIEEIPVEDILKFSNLTNHSDRINLIYKYASKIPVNLKEDTKNLKTADEEKFRGNKYFAKKDYDKAIKSYNNGIIRCPTDTDSSKELLAILVANRSATFFEMKEFRKVLNDIDYVIEIDAYPKQLHYKILLRKAKCYDALHNEKLANEVYCLAFDHFKCSGFDEDTINKKIEQVNADREKFKSIQTPLESTFYTAEEEIFIPNKVYIASHNAIYFDEDIVHGRYARAKENLSVGQLIIQESPHSSVLLAEKMSINCQHCLISTKQIFACPRCSNAVFCSSNCERMANRTYHKYECTFLNSLFESGASINCSLAIRIVTQKEMKYFNSKMKYLQDFMQDNCKKTVGKINPYRSDDYLTAFFLCRNESSRSSEELLHYTCMSIFLLKLLRIGGYFGKEASSGDDLTREECFISTLMLRHLELLQFNCHEVAELRNTNENDCGPSYKLECIGAGLYPTASLFNHSCDPSIVRYNIRNKLIVRTIKPIKKDEIIYENYGPIYTTMKSEFRQEFLKSRYWFECLCKPCVEYWPLLEKMDENELRIGCKEKKCSYVFLVSKTDVQPFLVCEYCGQRTNIFPVLKNLMDLQKILPNAEYLYDAGNYQDAMKLYIVALTILYQHLEPPCPDMVKVQQRLRTCYVNCGNTSLDYIPDTNTKYLEK